MMTKHVCEIYKWVSSQHNIQIFTYMSRALKFENRLKCNYTKVIVLKTSKLTFWSNVLRYFFINLVERCNCVFIQLKIVIWYLDKLIENCNLQEKYLRITNCIEIIIKQIRGGFTNQQWPQRSYRVNKMLRTKMGA